MYGRRILASFIILTSLLSVSTRAYARSSRETVRAAITQVFGRYAQQALHVAWCESRWRTDAHNGQYLGLFQMGTFARGKFGHGHGAWAQARAAYRYFVYSGRDWSPWTCRP